MTKRELMKAVVLLSGGLDSATTLYWALSKGYRAYCLIFDYGQRHKREIEAARKISKATNCKYKVVKVDLPWKGGTLLDKKRSVPKDRSLADVARCIPSTYVPARNIIFLSLATSCAESIGASALFIGAHQFDFSGYPDCRPRFFQAFRQVIKQGTKAGTEKKNISIKTPLLNKTKAEIIKVAKRLGVPFELTWSCYKGGRVPCGRCDSCRLRAKGFKEAGIKDPLDG